MTWVSAKRQLPTVQNKAKSVAETEEHPLIEHMRSLKHFSKHQRITKCYFYFIYFVKKCTDMYLQSLNIDLIHFFWHES